MTTIKSLIGEIRSFTKNVINVKDFYLSNWDDSLIAEYIENYDLNQEVITIFKKIFKYVKNKLDNPGAKGCIDLLGSFGTGKSHILLFLAVILSKETFSGRIQKSIGDKLNENPDFYEIYNDIYTLLNKPVNIDGLSGVLIIPIRLAEFRMDELNKIIERAVTRDILKRIDTNETLITDVKKLIKFFETKQKNVCRDYIDSTDFIKFEKLYSLIKNQESVNYSEVEKAAKIIDQALHDSLEISGPISKNPLLDICKHPLLGRKYKNIIFLFDELTQWWKKSNDELLDELQTIAGRIDDLASFPIENDEGNSIENNNIIAIFSHQRDVWIGNKGNTVQNRFEVTPPLTGTYINSIIAKRFFYMDQYDTDEITKVANDIYDNLELLKIPTEIIEKIYSTNPVPDIANTKNFKEKIIKNIVSFYPFHPFLFSSIMKSVFLEFSTENRGILNFVDDCFQEYIYLFEEDAINLINSNVFFMILDDKKLLLKKKEASDIYEDLEKARKKYEPNDKLSLYTIQTLILKLISKEGNPRFLKDEIRAIFSIKENDFISTVEKFIDFCITKERIQDINITKDYIELTLDKTIPIRIYSEQLKSKINGDHIYNAIKDIQEIKINYVKYNPRNSFNLRYKKLQFIDFYEEIEDIISIIQSKDNSMSNIKGKQNRFKIEVFDLIYYFLPPRQEFIIRNFKPNTTFINKIKDPKINFIICKPKVDIILFNYADEIKNYISLTILQWSFDNIDPIQHGEAEPLYKEYFEGLNMTVPSYSDISDVLFDVTSKNINIISDLKNKAKNLITELNEMKDEWLKEWLEMYECHYNFGNYIKTNYDKDEILDLEDEFEEFKYPHAFELEEELTGAGADHIWKLIWKDVDTIPSTRTAQYINLEYGVKTLKLLRKNDMTYSIIEEKDLHRTYKKLEEYIDGLTDKEDIRSICYKFRINNYGMSIYLTSLGLFYLNQRGKIKFYNSSGNPITKSSKYKKKKGTILEKTLSFINDLVNQKGKIGKVELFPANKWIFIINTIKEMKDEGIFELDTENDDKVIIDLDALIVSQSFEREDRLFDLLKKHSSIENLNEINNKFDLYLTRLRLQSNKKVKSKLGILYFLNLIKKLKEYSDCEELYNYLKSIEKAFKISLAHFKVTKMFYTNRLDQIISIWDSCENFNL